MELVGFHYLAMNQPIVLVVVKNHQFPNFKMDRSSTYGSQGSLIFFSWDYNYWSCVNIHILFSDIPLSSLSSHSSIFKKRIYSSWYKFVLLTFLYCSLICLLI